jgi:hypothetical protein
MYSLSCYALNKNVTVKHFANTKANIKNFFSFYFNLSISYLYEDHKNKLNRLVSFTTPSSWPASLFQPANMPIFPSSHAATPFKEKLAVVTTRQVLWAGWYIAEQGGGEYSSRQNGAALSPVIPTIHGTCFCSLSNWHWRKIAGSSITITIIPLHHYY